METLVIAHVILFGPLLLAVLSLALALWAGPGILRAASGLTEEIAGLTVSLARLQQGIADLPLIPETFDELEPELVETKEPVALSPLQRMIEARVDWLKSFHAGVSVCASSTGLSINELTRGAWPPDALTARLQSSQNEEELSELDQKLDRLVVEIVQVLLSKCDHDLDPEFRNARLQEAIERLATKARLQLYMPQIGEPVDKRLHISLGVGARAGEELRGTVASVRARGLIDARDTVITRAEIREYD